MILWQWACFALGDRISKGGASFENNPPSESCFAKNTFPCLSVCWSAEVFWCKNMRDGNTCTCVNTWTNGITCVRAKVFGRIHLVFVFFVLNYFYDWCTYVVFVWIVSQFHCLLAIESFVKVETIVVIAHRARDAAQMTETSHHSSPQLWWHVF